ncbi:MAG: glycine--tRNA ligase, partial [Candidatus Ranarchaeia archaeon]
MAQFDEIIKLGKRRGFFFQSGEIYPNKIGGIWEYAPYGVIMKRRIENLWRKIFVHKERMYEIEGSSLLPKRVFEASGHLESFVDPLAQCVKCKQVHRVDKLLSDKLGEEIPEGTPLAELDEMIIDHKIVCPKCRGQLSPSKHFNLMFSLEVGAEGSQIGYLRPETCQNIFINFNLIQRIMRAKLPLGIAQIGKSYRNEISPRRGLIRLREFTQAEAEIFFNPDDLINYPLSSSIKETKLRINLVTEPSDKIIEISAQEAVSKGYIMGTMIVHYMVVLQNFFDKLGIPRSSYRFRELSS